MKDTGHGHSIGTKGFALHLTARARLAASMLADTTLLGDGDIPRRRVRYDQRGQVDRCRWRRTLHAPLVGGSPVGGGSSDGRALAFQAGCRGFEPRPPLRSGGGCRVCALASAVVLGSSKGTASNQPGPERHSWAVVGPKMLAVARRSSEWRGRYRRAGCTSHASCCHVSSPISSGVHRRSCAATLRSYDLLLAWKASVFLSARGAVAGGWEQSNAWQYGSMAEAGIAKFRCAWPPSMTRTPDSAACSVTWTASSGVQLSSGDAQDHDQGVAHQLCASSHSRLKRQTQHPYAQRMVPSPRTNSEEYVARSSMSRETGHVLQSS